MKIFLSGVSSEFQACRDALASDLRAVDAEVMVQPEFTQQGHTLLEKLEAYIANCDRVIALVGNAYGWEPEPSSLPAGTPRRSYTQWEYAFARGERLDAPRHPAKDTFVYFATPAFLGPHASDQPAECAALQQNFIASFRETDQDHSTFGSIYELRALVLRDGFRLGTVTAQPDLILEVFPLTDSTRFFYGAQRTPIVGRERELAALGDFLKADARVAWWLMSGPAGAGKSRTALEACLRAMRFEKPWQAGWLTNVDAFDGWKTWQPKAPTLIIVDDAARSADAVRKMIVALYQRRDTLAHPVRVLLIERDAAASWRERLTGAGADRHSLEASLHAAPLVLGGLNETDLWEIVRTIVDGARPGGLPDRGKTLASLRKIDALKRPLFASFAADAIAAGRDIERWDQKELLESLLKTEMLKQWAPAGVTEEDKNLLTVATLSGGLPLTILKHPPIEGWLPRPRDYVPERYRLMCGRPSDTELSPLTPPVLGEFFVLEQLRPSSAIDERPAALLDIALALPSKHRSESISYGWTRGEESVKIARLRQHLYFAGRCARDFPDHPSLNSIMGPLPARDDNWWGWSVDVANLIEELLDHSGTLDFCEQLHDALYTVAFEQAEPRDPVALYRVCNTGLTLVMSLAHAGNIDATTRRCDVLRKVAAFDPALARFQIAAGSVLAKLLAINNKLPAAHATFDEVFAAWETLDEDARTGPAYALVFAASTLVHESVNADTLDAARKRYNDLRRAAMLLTGNASLARYDVAASVSLAKAYVARGMLTDARVVYDDLCALTERHSRASENPSPPGVPTAPVESDPKPVITATRDESGSSITLEWTPSPESRMGQRLERALEAVFIEPLLGRTAATATEETNDAEPDPGPNLRHRLASFSIELLRAYSSAEDLPRAIEVQRHLRDLARRYPDEPPLPFLYGHGTYIVWRMHLIGGGLSAAATAADELHQLAVTHGGREAGYTKGFALAAYPTIIECRDHYPAGVAVLAQRWGNVLRRDEVRAVLASDYGPEDAERFYALLAISTQTATVDTPGASTPDTGS